MNNFQITLHYSFMLVSYLFSVTTRSCPTLVGELEDEKLCVRKMEISARKNSRLSAPAMKNVLKGRRKPTWSSSFYSNVLLMARKRRLSRRCSACNVIRTNFLPLEAVRLWLENLNMRSCVFGRWRFLQEKTVVCSGSEERIERKKEVHMEFLLLF
jgi:hypothetical protein